MLHIYVVNMALILPKFVYYSPRLILVFIPIPNSLNFHSIIVVFS